MQITDHNRKHPREICSHNRQTAKCARHGFSSGGPKATSDNIGIEIETNKGSLESVMIARGQKEEEASHK